MAQVKPLLFMPAFFSIFFSNFVRVFAGLLAEPFTARKRNEGSDEEWPKCTPRSPSLHRLDCPLLFSVLVIMGLLTLLRKLKKVKYTCYGWSLLLLLGT
jgi:hypothetical protein